MGGSDSTHPKDSTHASISKVDKANTWVDERNDEKMPRLDEDHRKAGHVCVYIHVHIKIVDIYVYICMCNTEEVVLAYTFVSHGGW